MKKRLEASTRYSEMMSLHQRNFQAHLAGADFLSLNLHIPCLAQNTSPSHV